MSSSCSKQFKTAYQSMHIDILVTVTLQYTIIFLQLFNNRDMQRYKINQQKALINKIHEPKAATITVIIS